MGAWGYKALESDEGLDVVAFLQDFMEQHKESNEITLSGIIQAMKQQGFFGKTFEEIDFFYDISAMALAELYSQYLNTGTIYGQERKDGEIQWVADEGSLTFLLRYLQDIRDEIPDQQGSREIVELWQESKSWPDWQSNLAYLIQTMEQEISRLPQ
ncbi:DUF4259 domain-containing protein [Lysinibacillus fusiformis]|uniref:DUF4259 domain-containing protein n=1 Tax=Lysinibacillus fusiformis TaxID=28031 RepID=UPI0019672846|nr:DUF4259 domain-containing protein [Lysinibacillus fusiformis]QSB09801.1 DUF4259 domain-containing protein [Lysinibacillus fusiformis]